MPDSITSVANKSAPQEILNAAKAAPQSAAAPIKTTVATAQAPAAPSKPASVVELGQASKSIGLYSADGTTAAPPVSKSAGTANADGSYTAGKDAVSISIEKSDSGYDNKIYYSTDNFATRHLVGIDNQTGTVNLGSFKEGTRIDFGIDNGHGDFFRTGGASANSDNFKHTATSTTADGNHQVGFEDLRGGGDRDFNDAIITVRSVPAAPAASAPVAAKPAEPAKSPVATAPPIVAKPAEPAKPPVVTLPPVAAKPAEPAKPPVVTLPPVAAKPAEPAKPPVVTLPPVAAKPATPATTPVITTPPAPPKTPVAVNSPEVKDNRSGLGYGTNPGQGAGRVNSPNTGTLNPSANHTPNVTTPVVAKPTAVPTNTSAAPVNKPVIVAAPPVTVAKPVVAAATGNDNRSGLGDGTNPGQGAGKTNSPNTGTLNPSVTNVATTTSASTSTGKKTDDAAEVKVTGVTIDKKVESALKAYQISAAPTGTTSIRV